ncbi:MAG: Peptide chain release factor 1 [Syntrophorhabdaceae bacterium PtaU1.Bin034]|nr:MAG: Peptide chain release factor 1 [Syntrophorhabdaceae bacterium PtaU1.Bin034]
MILEKLEEMEMRLDRIEADMALPGTMADMEEYKKLAKEHAELRDMVTPFREWKRVREDLEKTREMIRQETDEELKELAREEAGILEKEDQRLEALLKNKLLAKDEEQVKNTFLEIRAGTGGEEAALFARDLFSMYMKYAEKMRWKTELLSMNMSDLGGLKEVVMAIEAPDAFQKLKYESGVHRVQRVPETESQGRIHTSTVTVAVLPEPEELELNINPDELRIDVYRSSGPGGQHVNTTDSAVRITHIPSGLVVTCQDEKSQHKNKAKALRVLRARLKERMEQEKEQEVSEERRKQVGTGDRSERIRTYNFPQGRVTDHRIGLTLYKLEDLLAGNIDPILDPLVAHFQAESLKAR